MNAPEQLTLDGIIDDLTEDSPTMLDFRVKVNAWVRVEAHDLEHARGLVNRQLQELRVIHPYSLHVVEAP